MEKSISEVITTTFFAVHSLLKILGTVKGVCRT